MPGNIDLAVGSYERISTNHRRWTTSQIVDGYRITERSSTIGRTRKQQCVVCRRFTRIERGIVPCNVNIVAERAVRIGVHGDVRLIIELAAAAIEVEERDLGPGFPSIGGFGYRHLGALNRGEGTVEEDNDVGIVDIAKSIEGDTWI